MKTIGFFVASPPAWSQDAQFAEFFQETQKYRAAGEMWNPIRVLRSGDSDIISFSISTPLFLRKNKNKLRSLAMTGVNPSADVQMAISNSPGPSRKTT